MALMLGSASPAPATTEQELIDAARVGDDRAFEELYARYRERIGMFIRSRMRDHARAEDVAQEVFISALRRLRSSEQEIVFKPWIYEIAKNACIDEYRRNQRSREVSLDADDELSNGRGALLSIAPTPAAAVESKQKLDDLRGAFSGLSESHHQLLVMREFEGLSYDEIGHRTGMSRQMVESALFRARRKLGVEYEELASGRRCLQVQTTIEAGRMTSRRALGVRERRQLARHLAHCQPCRVKAHLAGVDDSFVRPGVGAKIAALLPFPALRWWPFGRAARVATVRGGSHPAVQAAAGGFEPGTSALFGGAAVAVALVIAGSGGPAAPAARHPGPPVTPGAAAPARPAATAGAPQTRTGLGVSRLTQFGAGVPQLHVAGPSAAPTDSGPSARRTQSTGAPKSPAGTRAGAPSLGSSTGRLTQVGGSVAASTVQRATATVSPVVTQATQTIHRATDQTPVAKTVTKVFATSPILTRAGGSGSGGSAATSLPPASLSPAGSAPSTVNSVTKKIAASVGTLLAHP